MKRLYRVTEIELTKGNHSDNLSWVYAGKRYECDGEFYVDEKGILHHTFITERGKQVEIKIKY